MLKSWHRRLGLVSALFVLVLSASGILLNHISHWGLDTRALPVSALKTLYRISLPDPSRSYALGDRLISALDGAIYVNAERVASCEGALSGVVEWQQMLVLGCSSQLVLMTPEFQLIEKIGASDDLPSHLEGIAATKNRLLLKAQDGFYVADLDALSWERVNQEQEGLEAVQWSQAIATPPDLVEELMARYIPTDITYERLLLDIHSGRLLGTWGVYLMDAMAMLFMVLAISGVWMWRQGRGSGK